MSDAKFSVELNLAAALSLLSSIALRGVTPAKAKALRMHLRAISTAPGIADDLRHMAANLLAQWDAVECHSASCPIDHAALVAISPTTH